MGDEGVEGWGGEDLVFLQTVDVKCFHQLGWGGGGGGPPPPPPQPPPWGYFSIPFFVLSFVVSTDTLLSMLVLQDKNRRLHFAHLCTVFGNMF